MVEHKHWQTLEQQEILKVPGRFTVRVEKVLLPDQRVIDDFYKVDICDAVMLFVETEDGKIVCERQYKHGPGAVTYTLPAGHMDPGETPEQAASRELREETGYGCEGWQYIGSFVNTSNQGCGTLFVLKGTGAKLMFDPEPEHDYEDIEIVLLSRDEIKQAVAAGEFRVMSDLGSLALCML